MEEYLGIDVGGSFIKYGVINKNGSVLLQNKIPSNRKEPGKIIESLIQIILKIKNVRPLVGVALSIPGVISEKSQMLTSGALEGLYRYNLAQILGDKTKMKVCIVNDAKAVGYAEKWIGAGKNCHNFVCLPLGTGVGGTIVLNGKVIQGRTGAAGEFGLMLMGLGKSEPVGYDSASFHCGAVAGLCRIYNRKLGNRAFEDWELDIKKILLCASQGQLQAIESLEEFYNNVAVLLLNITVSLDPEKILIGGGISENETIMDGIKKALKVLVTRYPEISAIGTPAIESCQLGNAAGMIGAVARMLEGERKNEKYGEVY